MRSYYKSISGVLAVIILAVAIIAPVPVAASPGLHVKGVSDPIPLMPYAFPGEAQEFVMEVSLDPEGPPMKIVAQVEGFGQALDGTLETLAGEDDTSPYSAVSFFTVAPSEFTLEPGGSQEITVTGEIPDGVGEGGRYAVVEIRGVPAEGHSIGMAPAIDIPLLLSVSGTERVKAGEITEFSISEIVPGEPIDIVGILKHTGNYHYKARAQVTLTNELGLALGTIATSLTTCSIIPTCSREFKTFLPSASEVVPGTYYLDLDMIGENGVVLASETKTLVIDPEALIAEGAEDSENSFPMAVIIGLAALFASLLGIIFWLLLKQRRKQPRGEGSTG